MEYSLWFFKRETELRKLHEDNYCNSMEIGVEEFCKGIYDGRCITYEDGVG